MRGYVLFLAIAAALTLSACATSPASQAALVGVWRQSEADCAGATPVRELIFHDDGTYAVTWAPFETYKDYWGHWRFDPRTHVLSLTSEGGNYLPSDRVLSGAINLSEHTLDLSGLSLGSPRDGGRCTAMFRR